MYLFADHFELLIKVGFQSSETDGGTRRKKVLRIRYFVGLALCKGARICNVESIFGATKLLAETALQFLAPQPSDGVEQTETIWTHG